MKKILTPQKLVMLLVLTAMSLQVFGQTQFWSDTFEDTGAPSSGTRTSSYSGGSGGPPRTRYFMRAALSEINVNPQYTNIQGSKFWAAEDVDAAPTGSVNEQSSEQSVMISGINITGKTGISFTGAFATTFSTLWDHGTSTTIADYIVMEYRVNNGSWVPFLSFRPNAANASTGALAVDNNADGLGDGTILTSAFTDFNVSLPVTGTTLDLRCSTSTNTLAEELAFDNFRLFEMLAVTPTITGDPSSASVCSGSTTSFTVTANNTPTSYTWQVSTNGGGNWTTINAGNAGSIYTNYTTATLNLSNVTSSMHGYQYRASATNGAGTSSYSTAATLAAFTGTWNGGTNAFNTSTNWTGCPVTTGIHAVINNTGTAPQVTGTSDAFSITIGSGASLTVTGTLNIGGSISNSGTFTASAGTIVLNGSTAQSIAAATFASNTVQNLTVNNSAGVTLGGALAVTGTLTPTSGVLTTGGNLTLRSTASGTARVAAGSTSGGYISGNVTMERYIPASGNRAWRLLSSPVTAVSAPSIYNAWQNGGVNTAGYGTHITQAGGAGTNGFDASTIALSSSIRHWNGTALQTPANTNSVTVGSNGGAYFLFVRGDRNININNGTATGNTTLRITGIPNQGNLTNVGTAGTSYSLIPNPYPSAVDFELVRNGNGSSINTFYSWDATLNSVGAYRTVERIGANNYQQTPSGGSAVTDATARYIQSGQAFFIPVNATLNFTESMKTSSSPSFNVFRTTSGGEELVVNLSTVDNSTAILSDGVRIKFDPSYTQTPGSEDIVKLTNFNENLSVINNGTDLVVEKRPMATTADTIDLHLWNTDVKDYRFSFDPLNFTGATAYLADKYLGTTTAIDLTTPGNIDFSVTTAAGSAAPDRFEIVFTPAGPLAATEITISGQEEGKGVRINWHVKDQQDIKAYEVQSSADGRSYNQVATVQAGSKPSYTTLDPEVLKTERYYRIKAVYTDDKTAYSQTLRLQAGVKAGTGIEVSPNPVAGQRIGLQWNNVGEGDYHVTLSNTGGQVVYRTAIKHAGGNGSYTLSPEQTLPAGVYYLSIMGEEREYNQQVLIGK